eukprot:jgi/Mesvir1/7167/Mv02527-RA.1
MPTNLDPMRELICPLSLDLMTDPVMLVETGEIFERSAIQGWFDRGNLVDPWTRQPLSSTQLVPVRLLRRLTEDWIARQQQQERLEQEQEHARELLGTAEDSSMMFIPPDRLTLGREIGSGGMGTVRVATLHPSEKEVAVKLLPVQSLTEDTSAAFRREVKVLQRGSLFCHNVCRFLGVTKIDNNLGIVMSKYEQSLDDAIKQARESTVPGSSGGLPYPRLLLLAQDICLAMADLHQQHIIVQDLKPANVLIDAYGRAVVADFGISVVVDNTLSMRKAASIVGSVNYMAPEQHDPDEGSGVTMKADAWAFGCLLVAMATGQAPWEGLQMRQVITNVLVRRQAPAIPASLPQGLQAMLQACFCFDPSGRPSFDEMLGVLRGAWGHHQRQQEQPPPQGDGTPGTSQAALQGVGFSAVAPTSLDTQLRLQVEIAAAFADKHAEMERLRRQLEREIELRQRLEGEVAAMEQVVAREADARRKLEGELSAALKQSPGKARDDEGDEKMKAVKEWMKSYKCCAIANPKVSTALHTAAKVGRVDVVAHLVQTGMDVNVEDAAGATPLYAALESRQFETIKYLARAGASINAAVSGPGKGMTPLVLAVRSRSLESVQCLVNARANVNMRGPCWISTESSGLVHGERGMLEVPNAGTWHINFEVHG